MSQYAEMEDQFMSNSPVHVEIDPSEVRNIARGVLGRAVQDMRNTRDYANVKGFGSKVFTSQADMISCGEEVREWFLYSSYNEVFGFENVCKMSGYDARKVREYLNQFVPPKNAHLASYEKAPREIISIIKSNNGITHSLLMKKMRGKYPTTVLRRAYAKIEEDGIAVRKRLRRDGVTEGILRWYECK